MQIVEIVSLLAFFACIIFATSSKYKTKKIPWMRVTNIPFKQDFYNTKVETLYQCMELCSQYSICKSLWESSGTCRLYKVLLEKTISIPTSGQYYEASWIPKSISGVCHNHTCSKDKQCVPLHSDDYMCIPHKFPTFTCEEDWYYSTRKCYYIYAEFEAQMSWQEAKNHCEKLQSNLTETQDAKEEEFLFLYYWYTTLWHAENNTSPFYWTSLKYFSEYKSWIWNASGRIQDASSFSNWIPNYQQLIKPNQDNCMVLSKNTRYQWTVANCSAKGVFFCERRMVY